MNRMSGRGTNWAVGAWVWRVGVGDGSENQYFYETDSFSLYEPKIIRVTHLYVWMISPKTC